MDPTGQYTHPDVGVNVGDVLDMDMVHDFGEGVGVDMRDFTVHNEDSMEDNKDLVLDPALNTPTLQPNSIAPQQLTPHAATSITNGHSEPPSSVNVDDMFQTETGLDGDDEDDDGDETPDTSKRAKHNDVPGGFTYVDKDGEPGRRKIRIEYITDKSRRHITFSKRKAGIMKKAYELSILTGTQVLLLVVSETGLVYTFTTTKLQPLVQKAEGKNLIQACLNAPEGFGPDGQPLTGTVAATKAKNGGLAIRPHKLTAAASAAMAASAQAAAGPSHSDHEMNAQQAMAADAVGHGTPVGARPKKRLPSGRGKKAAAAAAANGELHPNSNDSIPPVPSIPDIHRASSPNTAAGSANGSGSGNPHMLLASPMSAAYHIPPEYHHPHAAHHAQHHQQHPGHHQHPGHSPGPGQGYYPSPGQEYQYYGHSHSHGTPGHIPQQPQQQQQQQQQPASSDAVSSGGGANPQSSPHQQYMMHQHHAQQMQYQQQQQQQERQRLMGMGM